MDDSIECSECDDDITYRARHWDMKTERWYCVSCWQDERERRIDEFVGLEETE